MKLQLLACVLLSCSAPAAIASTISVNIKVPLVPAGIYNCGGDAFPAGALCWTTGDLTIPSTIVSPEDTLRLRIDFAGPYRLRWGDDGIVGPAPYVDEFVQVGWRSEDGAHYNNGVVSNAFVFHGVRGDLLENDIDWTFSGSMGGLTSRYDSNLTDSAFHFSGFTSTIGPFSGGTGLPASVDTITVFLGTGHFSFVGVIPEPSTPALLVAGLIGVGLARRLALSESRRANLGPDPG